MKAVLFDLDETLLDRTRSLIRFCEWQATDRLKLKDVEGYVARFLELDANGSVWKDEVYEKLKHEFFIADSVGNLLAEYILQFQNFCQARPGALDAVRLLASRGFKLGLVSNGKSPFQENNFSALGVGDLFTTLIVSETVGCSKPDPKIFEIACSAIEVTPRECIFVGDNPNSDIRGAADLGMYTVFVPSLYFTDCSHASAVCADFNDLAGIVENAVNK
jgi:putative hydrolase of the HAD superfamily